jgi:fumarylacetoacetate (FAA) hydrolase
MKLATRNDGTRDGQLVVVRRDGTHYLPTGLTLQAALDDWATHQPQLVELATKVEVGGEPLDVADLLAPLPRAYEWIDGSAYINHIVLVRKARNAEPPATLETDPLVYQGGSGVLLAPTADLELVDPAWGLDFESEICVILDDIPRGTKAADVGRYVRLVLLANDVTLRNLIPAELKKNFGFFNSKPATAFSPFAITPDELGDAWRDGRLHLRMDTRLNGEVAGAVEAGPEMHFGFFEIIEHLCKTRSFTAGTIVGSGTISNVDETAGVSCLAERRMREIIADGSPTTQFLKEGDVVEIEMLDLDGHNLFGTIRNVVVPA